VILPPYKPNKWYQSRWLILAQKSEYRYGPSIESLPDSVVQVKRVPLRNNDGTEKDRKRVLVVGNASVGGGVYQCG